MNKVTLNLLRALIVVLFAGGLLAQEVFIPVVAWESAQGFAEVSCLEIPDAALAIGTVACAQVILVATWRLAGMVERGFMFHAAALKWVALKVELDEVV